MTRKTPFFTRTFPAILAATFLIGCAHENTTDYRLDVRTGAWTVFRTEPEETQMVSTSWAREHVQSPEVRRLQQKSYTVAVNSLANPR